MIEKFQLTTAALALLGLGAFLPALAPRAAFATDDAHPSLLGNLMGHQVAPDPQATQIVDSVQSTNSSSSASASASASASSSVTVTGGQKQGKCRAEASANAKANGVEDSDHELKVAEGDGCSAKAESRATVKQQRKQQSE